MKLNFIQRLRNFETFSQKNEPYRVPINFIQSNLNFGHQMAGYQATIEIEAFQRANNGLAIKISPARRKKSWLLRAKRPSRCISPQKRANFNESN